MRSFKFIRKICEFARKEQRNELFESSFLLILFLALVLASCASIDSKTKEILNQRLAEQEKISGSNASRSKADNFNTVLTRSGTEFRKNISPTDYIIGPEDLLDINVFQVEELKTEARVSARGYIKLPLVEPIKADGLTVAQLEKTIAKKFDRYLEEPVVSVFVKEFRSQQIAVLGAVKSPQVYYIQGQRYLLDMLSMAGGLTPEAGNVCIIQRATKENPEKSERIVIDMDELLVRGNNELNLPLVSGDVIHVPQSGIFFVDGAVNSPGSFPLKGKMTVTQAISMAKGLVFEASKGEVRIFRDTGKPQREMIAVNYKSILSGNTPDVAINDKDIIIVPKNEFKNWIKGLSTGLSFGAFRLGKGF
jgi:polysaccharide export outer membrane protein